MLEYVRFGFASNSSSSHSILLLNEKIKQRCPTAGYPGPFDSDFMLTNEAGKLEYLQNQCFLNFQESLGAPAAKKLVKAMFKKDFKLKDIDHQSIMCISGKTDPALKIEFLKQLTDYLAKNDKVAIWGSWDSGDGEGYDAYPGLPRNLFTSLSNATVVKKDGDYQWTLFDKEYGYKLKLKLNDTLAPTLRPANPELLDISITDRCLSNCSFCYRASNKEGGFASLEKIKKLIDGAANLDVFEIVFGGGEPTLHPAFPEILAYAAKQGIAANFTTNSVAWTKDVATLYAIARSTSSITVSVHSLADLMEKESDLEAAHNTLNALRRQDPLLYDYAAFSCFYRIIYQLVVDIIPDQELVKILKYASGKRAYLSLVGFKALGRAKDLLPAKKEDLKTLIDTNYDYSEAPSILSVDTCFLKEYPEFVQALTCNTREGWESFYIDATNEHFALSSFSPEIKKIDLTTSALEIEDAMHGFFKNLIPQ